MIKGGVAKEGGIMAQMLTENIENHVIKIMCAINQESLRHGWERTGVTEKQVAKIPLTRKVVGGTSMTRFPLVIAVSEWDMPGIEHGPLGLRTSALTNVLSWLGNYG
jgi:hypothetical protein